MKLVYCCFHIIALRSQVPKICSVQEFLIGQKFATDNPEPPSKHFAWLTPSLEQREIEMQWTPSLFVMSQDWTALERIAAGSLLGMGHCTIRAECALWVVGQPPFLCNSQLQALGRHQINHRGDYKHSVGSMNLCWSHGKRDSEGEEESGMVC